MECSFIWLGDMGDKWNKKKISRSIWDMVLKTHRDNQIDKTNVEVLTQVGEVWNIITVKEKTMQNYFSCSTSWERTAPRNNWRNHGRTEIYQKNKKFIYLTTKKDAGVGLTKTDSWGMEYSVIYYKPTKHLNTKNKNILYIESKLYNNLYFTCMTFSYYYVTC